MMIIIIIIIIVADCCVFFAGVDCCIFYCGEEDGEGRWGGGTGASAGLRWSAPPAQAAGRVAILAALGHSRWCRQRGRLGLNSSSIRRQL